ncbi:MAG: LamG domain-containing protein, partial [Nitrospinales bacterium]
VSFWFKADNVTQSQGLFSKDSSGFDTGGHLTIYIDTDSKLKARLQSVSGSHTLISSNNNPDTWYHVAFSFGEGGMELSLNGGTPVTNSYSGGFGSTSGGSGNFEPIVVGASGWHSGDKVATPIKAYFKGIIDELMLFDEKLSDTEIDELVAAGNNL